MISVCIGQSSRCVLGGRDGFDMVRSFEKDTWRAAPATGAVNPLRHSMGMDASEEVLSLRKAVHSIVDVLILARHINIVGQRRPRNNSILGSHFICLGLVVVARLRGNQAQPAGIIS